MQSWKSTLDVSDIWENEANQDLYEEIGKRIENKAAEMLENGLITNDETYILQSLGEQLKDAVDVDDFDQLWSEIYDWADTDKRLWIKTF